MRLLALLAAGLFAGAVMAAPVPKAKPQVSLDGQWEMAERHLGGTKEELSRVTRWTIDGESLVIQMAGRSGALERIANTTYLLTRPKDGGENDLDFTLIASDGSTPQVTFRGIAERGGDTFKFCRADSADGARPTEYKAAKGNVLYVFRRAEGEKAKKDK